MKNAVAIADRTDTEGAGVKENRFKCILFDLDGTLVDTMPAFAQLASCAVNRYTGMPLDEARREYLETSGIPFINQLDLIAPGHDCRDAMNAQFEAQKLSVAATAHMSADTLHALRSIRRLRVGISVSSNNNQIHVENFARFSPGLFDFALGHTPVLRKGEPHFDHARQYYNCLTEDILFVGDSLSDAAMARDCGVTFFAVTQTFSSARFRAFDPSTVCISGISSLPMLLE